MELAGRYIKRTNQNNIDTMILIRKNIDNEIVVAIGAISQNRAIKKAEVLQNQIQEVNTADWYLCGKDLSVYTRLEEIYVPMDRMILRSGRAVQVTQIGEKWVEIKSQGKIGYILRSDFDEYFSEISLNIG